MAGVLTPLLAFASALIVLARIGQPQHGLLALLTYLASWATFLYALHGFMRRYRATQGALRLVLRRKVLGLAFLGLVLAAAGYAVFVVMPLDDARLLGLTHEEAAALVAADRVALQDAVRNLDRAVARLKEDSPALRAEPMLLSPDQRQDLLARWSELLDACFTLETLKNRHRYFYQFNYLNQPATHASSFLIAYTAFVSVLDAAAQVRALTSDSAAIAPFLNEERRAAGIPGGTLLILQQALTRPDSLLLLNAGRANLAFLETRGHFAAGEEKELAECAKRAAVAAYASLGHEPEQLLGNPLDYYQQTTYSLWFPFQEQIANTMGDIHTKERPPLVSVDDLRQLKAKMEPGDIVLERRNWNLGNVGMPGFWSHAALFTGTLAQMDEYFAGQRNLTGGKPFSQYLADKFPAVRAAYDAREGGERPSVIEAVRKGVIIPPIEVSAHGDYVAALRPRLDRAAKLMAILAAYPHFGKPYDFDFDFATDNAVVCTELVFKAYEPRAGKPGIRFPLENITGRTILPPHGIAHMFDRELGTSGQQLDFISFYDGSEAAGRAFVRDAAVFRTTWRRSKWDLAQE